MASAFWSVDLFPYLLLKNWFEYKKGMENC